MRRQSLRPLGKKSLVSSDFGNYTTATPDLVYTGGSGEFQQIFIPVTGSKKVFQQSSEIFSKPPAVTGEIDEGLPKVVILPNELKNEINIYKENHLRPMSDQEYSRYLKMIKEAKDSFGNNLYKHDLSAIARVVKENYLKFFPSVTLDPVIDDAIEQTVSLDVVLKPLYFKSLEKYREPFILAKAEEVSSIYTPSEIQRLRGLGLSFVGDEYKDYVLIEAAKEEGLLEQPSPLKKIAFQHPLLQYNLLKK